MCSIFKYKDIVGRNFDYDVSYNEELRVIDRGEYNNKFKIIGMCTGYIKNYPLMYDGMNEFGVVCGALAFEGNAKYRDADKSKNNIPAYDFVFYILSNFSSVKSVKTFLSDNVYITNENYSKEFPSSDLHWFIADKFDSIIVEHTIDGLIISDATVMTNNPPYKNQKSFYLRNKKDIGNCATRRVYRKMFKTRGLETWNLKGDYTSEGRFIRLSWLKEQLEKTDNFFNIVNQGFHLLSSVEQIYGVTAVENNFEYTIYSIVYDMNELKVYIKFYDDYTVKEMGLLK